MWKESTVLADLDRLLNKVDHASGGQKRKREDEGDPTDRADVIDIEVLPALQAEYRMLQVGAGVPAPALGARAGGRSLPPNASNLISQYFTYTHCWLPIFDRPRLLRKLYEHKSNKPAADDAHLASIWAICAFTQFQQISTDLDGVVAMRRTALEVLPDESGPFVIDDIQTLLLIVLLDIGLGQWTSAWMLMGNAVRSLFESINTTYNNGQVAAHSRQSQATQQGAFILDTFLSWKLKRPSHLRTSHMRLPLLDEDGHDEWEPWAPSVDAHGAREPAFIISTFNRLTEVCVVINDSFNNESQGLTAVSSEHVAARLKSIATRFPFDCSIIVQRPPHQLLLHACYIACQNATGVPYSQSHMPITPDQVLQHFTRICKIPSLAAIFPTLPEASSLTSPQAHRPRASSMLVDQQGNSVGAVPEQPSMQAETQFGSVQPSLDVLSAAYDLQGAASAGIATSPSFTGDEIDALFHEMAQLDTTRWTDNRTQGLKDFGFADDSTFEAFCNDPDRLIYSDTYMAPAINSTNSQLYNQPVSTIQSAPAGNTHLGRMSFEDIFR
jgi:hypothetical protein